MAYTQTWNAAFEATPAAGDNISEGDDRIRELKVDIRERMAKDHYFVIAGTDADHGEHDKITFNAPQSADPANVANKGFVYTKDVSAKVELHWEDEDGNVVQISDDGGLFADHTAINYTAADDSISAHLTGIDTQLATGGVEFGCVLSNAAGDSDHDITISIGARLAASFDARISLSTAMTKRIDAGWTAGTGAGGFPTGISLANITWYHVFLIKNPTTGAVDAGFDTSLTATNLLVDATDYTKYKRLGSVLTDGSQNILGFSQHGALFLWDSPVAEADSFYPIVNTAQTATTTKTPTGVTVLAIINAGIVGSTGGNRIRFSSLNQTDIAATNSNTQVGTGAAGMLAQGNVRIQTNTSGQFRIRSIGGNGTLTWSIEGYEDLAGRFE